MGRRFDLFLRGAIWYAQLVDPETGCRLTARSTGQKDEAEARLVVGGWLANGLPPTRTKAKRSLSGSFSIDAILQKLKVATDLSLDDAGRIISVLKDRGLVEQARLKDDASQNTLIAFLLGFWDYETSPYVREKRAHHHSIGKRHAKESTLRVKRYWAPYFEGARLLDVRRQDLKDFSLTLADKGLAAGTINRILVAGTTALHWAHLNEQLATDPTVGIMRFSGKSRKRGVLTIEESSQLFAEDWLDERSRLGNLVAMTTGLRSGEVLALRREDIGEKCLNIRHSWSNVDGLKCPKNGEERKVPLLPNLREALLCMAAKNPYDLGDKGYIFYSTLPDRPMDNKVLLSGLKRVAINLLSGANPTEEQKDIAIRTLKERNIVFHSWRHFYSSRIADEIEARVVMQATGHKDAAVFAAYAGHATEADFQKIDITTQKVFSFADALARRAKEGDDEGSKAI